MAAHRRFGTGFRGRTGTAFEHSPQALHIAGGRTLKNREVGEIGERAISQMAKSFRRKDESFEDYLRHSHLQADLKDWARIHIEGFNAARKELISAASLIEDDQAAGKIEGDRSFRIVSGYDSIVLALLRLVPNVQLNSVVRQVKWRRGLVEVRYESALDGRESKLRCRHLIVTVPLGVLQAAPPKHGAILFDPEPRGILKAARSLRFGQVYRVTLRFRSPFWEEDEELETGRLSHFKG